MDKLIEYWPLILGILSALVGIGALVAKFTATPTDDTVFAFLGKLLGLIPKATPPAEEAPGEATEPLLRERTRVEEGDTPKREFLDR